MREMIDKAVGFYETSFLPKLGHHEVLVIRRGDLAQEWWDVIHVLLGAGLLENTRGPEHFRFGPTARDAQVGRITVREAIARWYAPQAVPIVPQINVGGNVGAIATGSYAVAHGTVNVSSVDAALHKLVEMQDQLDSATDELWKVLRRVREIEVAGADVARMKNVLDELEVRAFLDDLGDAKKQVALDLLKSGGPLVVSALRDGLGITLVG